MLETINLVLYRGGGVGAGLGVFGGVHVLVFVGWGVEVILYWDWGGFFNEVFVEDKSSATVLHFY